METEPYIASGQCVIGEIREDIPEPLGYGKESYMDLQ
jgi:hypothetical protein